MKCPHCKKDLTKDFRTVYRLGLQDGRSHYVKTINMLQKTNNALFEQLRVLDSRAPNSANSVYLSRKYCTRLIKLMIKYGMRSKAREINRIMNKQLGKALSTEAKWRELLSELNE